jgi:long-subunit acyl-CoA synthetase (AMP-forming)
MSQPQTMCEAFQATSAVQPDAVALRTPDGAVSITWREYADRVRRIAAGLAGLGVKRGDTVGIMLTNRPEFHLVDTGALHVGAIPFSIYNSNPPEAIHYLFSNAENRIVVTERQFVERLRQGQTDSQVEHVICVDGESPGAMTLDDLEASGDPEFAFEASWRAVRPDDVLTIIYTSGTTGPPKGVELTHANLLAEVNALQTTLPIGHSDRVLSYLPDAHIANRWGAHYNNLVHGMQITTVADLKQVVATLPSVRPTFFGAVPQTWYKVKAGIEAALNAEPSAAKRRLATWAIETGKAVAWLTSDRKPVPLSLRLRHGLADRLVLSKLRAKLGLDEVRVCVTGAAPIAPDALTFMLGLGLPVCEVWGMSELSAVATLNRPNAIRIGTVGQVVPGSEAKIAEDGELLVRGPLVMKGYRKDPEKTAETIDADGWLHTGDIASMDADGYVSIVDRKKELIINASGKNMAPSNIEGAIKVACPLIGSAVAIGDNRPYVSALLVLDPDSAAAYAANKGLTDDSIPGLVEHPAVKAAIEAGIAEANRNLSQVERVRRYTVLPTAWEPGGDEITPTMKLKRRPIAEKYAAEIEAMYA